MHEIVQPEQAWYYYVTTPIWKVKGPFHQTYLPLRLASTKRLLERNFSTLSWVALQCFCTTNCWGPDPCLCSCWAAIDSTWYSPLNPLRCVRFAICGWHGPSWSREVSQVQKSPLPSRAGVSGGSRGVLWVPEHPILPDVTLSLCLKFSHNSRTPRQLIREAFTVALWSRLKFPLNIAHCHTVKVK